MSGKRVQTTINVDDELYEQARQMTGIERLSTLFEEGLRALIQRESARRFAAQDGTDPNLRIDRLRTRPRTQNDDQS